MTVSTEKQTTLSSGLEAREAIDIDSFDTFVSTVGELIESNQQEAFLKLAECKGFIKSIRDSWLRDEDKVYSGDIANQLTIKLFNGLKGSEEFLRKNRDVVKNIGSYFNTVGALRTDLLESVSDGHYLKGKCNEYLNVLDIASSTYRGELGWSETEGRIWSTAEVAATNHREFLKNANEKEIERYNQIIVSTDFLGKDLIVLDHMINGSEHSRFSQSFSFIDYLARQLGLHDTSRAWHAWAGSQDKEQYRVWDNLRTIGQVKERRPDAVEVLHDVYGITAFHRYEIKDLITQYDEHGKNDRPYGLVVAAISDHNGALDNTRGRGGNVIKQLRDTLGDKQYVRVVEVENVVELGRRLINLDQTYGKEHKIGFVLLKAHGTNEASIFGGINNLFGRLSTDTNFGSAKKLFVHNPLIVMDSCSTGRDQGIAQHVSESLKATVFAPVEDSATVEYNMEIKDGKLIMNPQSGKLENDNNPFGGTTLLENSKFVNGKLVHRGMATQRS